MSRFTDQPFPSYTHVPGKTAHPVREPEGHSYGKPEPKVEQFDADRWQDCEAFLIGIDLFNAGFYWESHEQWEAVWHAVGRTGTVANFLKGLIKLAAAGVKLLEGRPVGVQRHALRASELFAATGEQCDKLCGFQMDALTRVAGELHLRDMEGEHDLGVQLQPVSP